MSQPARRGRRLPPLRFLLVAVALIALLHAWVGWRLIPDAALGSAGTALAVLALVASAILVPAGLLARALGTGRRADVVAWIGLTVAGLFSSLLVLTFLRELALLLALWALPGPDFAALAKVSAGGTAALALLMTVIGLGMARATPRVVDVEVPIDGLPAGLHDLTIAQISDVHVGPTIRRGWLDRVVDRVNGLRADVIAITGDLVDGSVLDLAPHTAPLARLDAPLGVYFVTGNHEYYSGATAWVEEIRRLGLTVLLNQHVVRERRGSRVVIAGVTDYSAERFGAEHRSDPAGALHGAPADAGVKLLLAHQPRSASAAAAAGFDLQLSGHTHGGQFLPWNFFVRLQQPFVSGLNRLGRLWVYTSRGTGYWGPPKRLGAPSEITLLRLRPAAP